MARRPTPPPLPQRRQHEDARVHHGPLAEPRNLPVPPALPPRHPRQGTHPFRFRKGDRTGFIAHNGIAHSYTRGRHASDSRNAILAWQAGQADLTDGSQGRFALIDHNGRLEWLTADHETIPGGTGAIEVSNTNWDTDGLIGYDLWEEAYRQGLEAGYETAIEETADSGYATTLDYTPPRR